ncbi:hypothetical protein ZIOFF_009504 [Zingiber officinale]|uniref:TRF2/HOY1 PH-like domain-containing protein n=1 Tax=Zingiber officinale TaxID=94328 RepID=A0A8J5LNT4_ZINOF|nr:hypothetical protein ZIOFF_009504 [Zingiber officinale]
MRSVEFRDHACRLHKMLYGLKQAPRAWYLELRSDASSVDVIVCKLYTKFTIKDLEALYLSCALAPPPPAVKLEVEEHLDEKRIRLHKRARDASTSYEQALYNNVLVEPGPLGLYPRKSRSLVDMIQMMLSYAKAGEVLEGGLKSKIEFYWSDITVIKAVFFEGGHGTLDIVLARPPLFFRETNPQPRKHTLWQATRDFTNDQAYIHRRHLLQWTQTLLSKNFEKLIDCNLHLKQHSQQPDIILGSPYFNP